MGNKILNNIVFFLLFYPAFAFTGPGGKIAKAVAETFGKDWGHILNIKYSGCDPYCFFKGNDLLFYM